MKLREKRTGIAVSDLELEQQQDAISDDTALEKVNDDIIVSMVED